MRDALNSNATLNASAKKILCDEVRHPREWDILFPLLL